MRDGIEQEIRAKTVVAAAGGFEANLAWLREAWGPAADNFLVRGTPYNVGRVLRILLGLVSRISYDPDRLRRFDVMKIAWPPVPSPEQK